MHQSHWYGCWVQKEKHVIMVIIVKNITGKFISFELHERNDETPKQNGYDLTSELNKNRIEQNRNQCFIQLMYCCVCSFHNDFHWWWRFHLFANFLLEMSMLMFLYWNICIFVRWSTSCSVHAVVVVAAVRMGKMAETNCLHKMMIFMFNDDDEHQL